MNTALRVAVLGAYGAVGHRIIAHAQDLGHVVTAAGRDPTRLAHVRADHLVPLAAGDTGGLRELARTQDVVVNATGIEDPDLAASVTDGGAAFLDISAEGRYLQQLGRLPRPRRPIVAGTGLAPGLTNLLAGTVPGHGPIHIGIVGGVGERHGDAGREWIWNTAGRAVNSGGTTEHVYRTVRRLDIPGLGRRRLVRAGFGEQDQLAVDLARPVSTWLGLDPAWATAALGLAGAVPSAGRYLDRLSGPLATLLRPYQRWAVVVTDDRESVAWASGHREVDATAAVAALCLRPLRAATPAVYAAHHLVTLHDLRDGLTRSGITIGGTTAVTGDFVTVHPRRHDARCGRAQGDGEIGDVYK